MKWNKDIEKTVLKLLSITLAQLGLCLSVIPSAHSRTWDVGAPGKAEPQGRLMRYAANVPVDRIDADADVEEEMSDEDAETREFEACKNKYQKGLGLVKSDSTYLDTVCENFGFDQDNLECALSDKSTYKLSGRAALTLCLVKTTESQVYSCAVDNLKKRKKTKVLNDSSTTIEKCRTAQRDALESKETKEDVTVASPSPREEQQQQQEIRTERPGLKAKERTETENRDQCPLYYEGQLYVDGKVGEFELRQSIAKWVNTEWCLIQNVSSARYFSYGDKIIEDLAIKIRREFRLYKVGFSYNGHNYSCTGTDFSPKGKIPNLTFFSLHECKDTETGLALQSIVPDLNYSFYSLVTPEFAKVMERMKKNTGDGNINFQNEKSPYLLMPY